MQALILIHKIDLLDKLNKKRIRISKRYFSEIKNPKIEFLNYSPNSVFHQFVIRLKKRNLFTKYLKKNKIEFGFHYPHTINQMKYFKKNFGNLKFVNAEKLAAECVSLPIDPMLKPREVDYIIQL